MPSSTDNALKLVVRGANVVDAPLYETKDCHSVEFYDQQGTLCALLIRGVLAPDGWAFANKLDDDWNETLLRFGYKDIPRHAFANIMQGK
jgi:hypothetical protein